MRHLLFALIFGILNLYANEQPNLVIRPATDAERQLGIAPHRFLFNNFPINKEIAISYRRVCQKNPRDYKLLECLTIDKDNFIVVKGNKHIMYATDFDYFLDGERIQYRCALKNGKVLCETSYVPYPVLINSKDNTFALSLELHAITPITNYFLEFKQLENNESLSITSLSEKEEIAFETQGQKAMAYSPDVIGKKGGISKLTAKRKNGDSLSIDLIWGTKWLETMQQKMNEFMKAQTKS